MSSVLTKEIIQQHLQKKAKEDIVIHRFFLIFIIWGTLACFASLWAVIRELIPYGACILIIPMVLLLSRTLIGLIQGMKQYRKGKHLRFWLVRDTLSRKDCYATSYDMDGTDVYNLYLDNYGNFQLTSASTGLCLSNDCQSESSYYLSLYEGASPGDTYYLVFTEQSNSIAIIIVPAAEWELSPSEFIERDGKICPTKYD